MATPWITAAALVALVIFIIRTVIDVWVALDKRTHLVCALLSYLNDAAAQSQRSNESFDKQSFIQAIESDPEYSPFILYDPKVSFKIQDLITDYSFLEGRVLDSVVTYMNYESYLQAIAADSRTEIVRRFSQERKIRFVEIYAEELEKTIKHCLDARDMVKEVSRLGKIDQLKRLFF